ncbi:hypothetical protein PWP93_25725 [Paraburkholderia sp. A1RI-2L]|uniref:hypothetical protein n=1 Tax=Paraburkholderia sp. A1RI-2L TaxID=3028367 RepID=UPI003B7C9E3D
MAEDQWCTWNPVDISPRALELGVCSPDGHVGALTALDIRARASAIRLLDTHYPFFPARRETPGAGPVVRRREDASSDAKKRLQKKRIANGDQVDSVRTESGIQSSSSRPRSQDR